MTDVAHEFVANPTKAKGGQDAHQLALLAPRERLEQVAPVGGEEEEAAAWWWQVERPHFWDGLRRAADATASVEAVQPALWGQ